MCTHISRQPQPLMGQGVKFSKSMSLFGQDDSIVFQASNPKRRRTGAWGRYEKYKVATTVGQARQLSATAKDLRHDVQHGFASVGDHLGVPAPLGMDIEEGMDIVHGLSRQ